MILRPARVGRPAAFIGYADRSLESARKKKKRADRGGGNGRRPCFNKSRFPGGGKGPGRLQRIIARRRRCGIPQMSDLYLNFGRICPARGRSIELFRLS